MAYKAERVIAMSASMPDEVGLLAKVANMWKADNVDMLSASAWAEGDTAYFMGVPKDPDMGRKCAATQGVTLTEMPAIHIEGDDEAGALQPVAQKLADARVSLTVTQAIAVHGKYSAILMADDYEKACAVLGI